MAKAKDNSTLLKSGGIDRIRRIYPDDQVVTVERPLWDSIAQEPARLSGVDVEMYSLRRGMNGHPLYGEASVDGKDESFNGQWQFKAAIEFDQGDEIQENAATEGRKQEGQAVMWISRKELEDIDAPDPKVGDVMAVWNEGAFDGTNSQGNERARFRYFRVLRANPHGNVMSVNTFVQWRVELKFASDFNPDRFVNEVTT